jgi:gamma-glutamylcyclotransferase (GGCT)/AIG2-like uncharacterized protein YtfP
MRLFVYGILKTTANFGRQLAEEGAATSEGPASLSGYALYGQGIAYALPLASGRIDGEVIRVDDPATLAMIDRIEGGYNRTPVVLDDGTAAELYVARYDDPREWGGPFTSWPFRSTAPQFCGSGY